MISIIIPVYNAEKYLERCLDSILRQLESKALIDKVELIAVDDGSLDNSLNILREYEKKINNMQVIQQPNGGSASARNAGLEIAKGEWVYFTDPDDYIAENALETMMNVAQSAEAYISLFIFDAYEHKGEKVGVWEHYKEEAFWAEASDMKRLQNGVLYSPCAETKTPLSAPWDKLYRRSFLTENGLQFNEELKVLDDMFFNFEVMGQASGIRYVKERIYHYIRNEGTITSGYTPDRLLRDERVWQAIYNYISGLSGKTGYDETDVYALKQAFAHRVIKSYAISLRLCIFNKNNKSKLGKKMALAKETLKKLYYNDALKQANFFKIEWKLKPVLVFCRLKFIYGIYLLCKCEEALRRV